MLQLLGLLGPVLDRLLAFIPDPAARERERASILKDVMDRAAASDAGQLSVNKAEAEHASVFVAGWRPAAGWLCVFGVAYDTLLLDWANAASNLVGHPLELPAVDTENLWVLLFGLLGMGALRTVEKRAGVTR